MRSFAALATTLAAVVGLACVSTPVHAAAPGVRASMSQAGINYLDSVAVPMLVNKIQGMTIADVPFDQDGFEGSITDITIRTFGIGSAGLTIDGGKGLEGSLSGLTAAVTANWNYKLKIWPHPGGSGSVDASVSGSSASLLLDVVEASGVPQLAANNVNVNVGDISLEFHGGLSALILNILKDLFMGTIKSEIAKTVTSGVSDFVNKDANAELAKLKLNIPLPFHAPYNITTARFELTDDPDFDASGFIGVDLLGDIVNTQNPQPAPFSPPALPAFSSSAADHYLQLFLSPFVLESAVWVYEQAGLLQFIIKPTDIPPGFPLQLNTSSLALLAPGMATAYPNDKVQIALGAFPGQQTTVAAATTGVTVTAPLSFAFQPQTASGTPTAFTLGCNMTATLNLVVQVTPGPTSTEQVVKGNLTYLECPLELVSSNVGTIQYSLLKVLIDFVLPDLILPSIDVLLNLGLPLPSLDGVVLKDTELQFGNGYVLVASNFAFNGSFVDAPASAPATTPASTKLPVLLGVPAASNNLRGQA